MIMTGCCCTMTGACMATGTGWETTTTWMRGEGGRAAVATQRGRHPAAPPHAAGAALVTAAAPRRAAPRSGRSVSDGGCSKRPGAQPTAKHNTHLRLGDGERHRRNLGGNGNRLSAYGRGHGRRHPAVL